MESRKAKKLRRPDNLTARTALCCRETGDHVHYPPTRLSRSTRPHNAPLYTGFESYFRITGKASYGECRKNQAAATGGTAYDGCGEFVSATAGEDSVNCAACGCHRSSHCEESISYATNSVTETVLEVLKPSSYELRQIFFSPYGGEGKKLSRGDRIVKDRSGGGDSTEEEEERVKRLRTKFTAEQTEKMRNYAEKLRWKVSHERREKIDEFCVAIGVNREKFRIWINNHKEKN